MAALDELVYPETRGNPMSRLRWTSKSSTKLAEELVRQGYDVSSRSVLRLLHLLGYSLQANAKVTEGRQHPDRDAQFHYLNDQAEAFIDDDQPVISVDTKKKELIGDYANGGTEWSPAGEPERVDGPRLRRPRPRRVRQGHPLWDLRRGQRRGLGQRRRHGRHRPASPSNPSAAGGTRWAGTASPAPSAS